MEKYKCKICGKKHEIVGGIELIEPVIIRSWTSEEKEKRKVGENYLIDKFNVLIKADLFIKINSSDEQMNWKVWVKSDPQDFVKMTENFGKEFSSFEGELYVDIPFYPNSSGLKVKLIYYLNIDAILPEIEIIASPTELSEDYQKGLSFKQVVDWMSYYYHPKYTENRKVI